MLIFLASAAIVLSLQWLVISIVAVRAFDSSLLAAVRILAGQMLRWVSRCQRALDRASLIHSSNEEFHKFAAACASTRIDLEKILTASSRPRYAEIVLIGDILQSAIANLREAEIAFVNAYRKVSPVLEQAGHGLLETENIRARINATSIEYAVLCEQRNRAARRIPGTAPRRAAPTSQSPKTNQTSP